MSLTQKIRQHTQEQTMDCTESSLRTKSTTSRASTRSKASSTEAAATKARAKAEAAKVRLSFAQKEMTLKVEKAQLDVEKAQLEAKMDMLLLEQDAAAALAKVEVLEAAVEGSDRSSSYLHIKQLFEHSVDTLERTKEYIATQAQEPSQIKVESPHQQPSSWNETQHYKPPDVNSIQHSHLQTEHNKHRVGFVSTLQQMTTPSQPEVTSVISPSSNNIRDNHQDYKSGYSSPLHSKSSRTPCQPVYDQGNVADFARYLAHRELVTTSLIKFSDQPCSYRAWKQSFVNSVRGLNITSSEEMDLLVTWLGKESAEHAKRIRAVHVNSPDKGLKRIWDRLETCYGAPEMVEDSLFKRIHSFPKIINRDYSKLHELSDFLIELEAAKEDGDLPGLAYLDTARGINPLVQKLPFNLQEKWLNVGTNYKLQHNVTFPPFYVFVDFIGKQAIIRNDPGFKFAGQIDTSKADRVQWKQIQNREVSVHKIDFQSTAPPINDKQYFEADDPEKQCPIHKKPHMLHKCRAFRAMPLEQRKEVLKENGICFKCCTSTQHIAKNCKCITKCTECESAKHISALHPGPAPWIQVQTPLTQLGGEQDSGPSTEVSARCTDVCGGDQSYKSCSKICLVKIYPSGRPEKSLKVYAIIDEQSNKSLARSEFFEIFNIQSPSSPYTLRTCSGVTETTGRRASGYNIESMDGKVCLTLPSLLECDDLPNNRSEIPTPNAAANHTHLKSVANLIPELDPNASIMLLLGRDIISVHKVRKQVDGPRDGPYAQKLDLGWVIVGNVCLGGVHKPTTVNNFNTITIEQRRPTVFTPCPNVFQVKERHGQFQNPEYSKVTFTKKCKQNDVGATVFRQTKDDNKVGPSIDDITFLQIMERDLKKDITNSWVAPLPFKTPRPKLPDNKVQALKRFSSLRRNFERKPVMKEHFFSFMEKIFQNEHAEIAPQLTSNEERWYLPAFGVYHPKKPGNIRVVFDSSAQYNGVSLNDVLLTGPDLNNTLIGVLLRFRKEAVAITADIQQMYHCFLLREEDRNYLRFLWSRNNNSSEDIMEYRMRVHVFGNCPSPAVAIYCLRQSVKNAEPVVKQFVNRDFYVDDGLTSLPSVEAAVKLLKRTQEVLSDSNLRLHKIASNKGEVMNAFPSQDHAINLKDLDFTSDILPMQRSLGLNWDLMSDTFTFQVADEQKPFTRRGVLSTVNSIYDPLGFLAPVTIQGKLILRELMENNGDWDAPLPQEMEETWSTWRCSLKDLSNLHIPRVYTQASPTAVSKREIVIFCDASTKAIAAVAYLKITEKNGTNHVGFLMGKAKLTPLSEQTVPRLELCSAVLAVELAELITSEMDMEVDITFYSDSKIVLGYISNDTRRFYLYVSNRVQRIRSFSHPEQWKHVSTEANPADIATRSVSAKHLSSTTWLCGPAFLKNAQNDQFQKGPFELSDPSLDTEVRPHVSTLNTTAVIKHLGSQRFSKFSSWRSLIHAIARLTHIARLFQKNPAVKANGCKGWHHCHSANAVEELAHAKKTIIRAVQEDIYAQEYASIKNGKGLSKDNNLKALDPLIDADGLLRIGGRIKEAKLSLEEKSPLIIPGKHHISTLLVRHYHQKIQHQGRLFTEGALRAAGFWIVGGKRRVSSVIYGCVKCRKLRALPQTQKMADLPADRLSTEPPFTNVGLDVFGPWTVSARRTRGGLAQDKRWAVLFTCMSVRAVHIEVIESLDTSCFINALRRFLAIRGPVKLIRSDRGTNFISACKELKIPSNIDNTSVEKFLSDQDCRWMFNVPHASHMGGPWERMIGVARRILDAMFLQLGTSKLTHEGLSTLMAEVTAIINARPLVPVSTDPDDPQILSPATLLTQKVSPSTAPVGDWVKDLHKQQWRQIQHLAQTFWNKWKKQYLSTLQPRRKWHSPHPNLLPGSVVLLKDDQLKRNHWPLGLITQVFPSKDGRVRKVEIKVSRKDGTKVFLRPVTETILLMAPEKP
ncbi:uncharacterized protein LOC133641474 isoform X1 [Entelurus aequoreus]|uniref:uncharacterized protein LOC133641474 isoform X1 n=1 Tax=Entelurus aequoreus TaxID=161455 RepID=UPI002B1DC74C|nr:uncharacterized protein LOC133641474 isoform X1 [Entelurus aequoreus]